MDEEIDTKKLLRLLTRGSHQDYSTVDYMKKSLFEAYSRWTIGSAAALATMGSLYLLTRWRVLRFRQPLSRSIWSQSQRGEPLMVHALSPPRRSEFEWVDGITRYMTEEPSWWNSPDRVTRFEWTSEMNKFVAKYRPLPGDGSAKTTASEASVKQPVTQPRPE